jgi:transcriptional regulator
MRADLRIFDDPKRLARLVELRRQGLPDTVIAERFSTTTATVSMWLKRALAKQGEAKATT